MSLRGSSWTDFRRAARRPVGGAAPRHAWPVRAVHRLWYSGIRSEDTRDEINPWINASCDETKEKKANAPLTVTRTRWPPDPAAISSRPTSSTVVRDDPAVRLLYARAAHTRLEIARALGRSASMLSADSRDSASARAHGMLARRVKSKPRAEISQESSQFTRTANSAYPLCPLNFLTLKRATAFLRPSFGATGTASAFALEPACHAACFSLEKLQTRLSVSRRVSRLTVQVALRLA